MPVELASQKDAGHERLLSKGAGRDDYGNFEPVAICRRKMESAMTGCRRFTLGMKKDVHHGNSSTGHIEENTLAVAGDYMKNILSFVFG